MLALVMKSKRAYGNVLGYDTKTKEYVYLSFNKEIWRTPSTHDGELFEACNARRINGEFLDIDEIRQLKEYPIYEKYSDSCQKSFSY